MSLTSYRAAPPRVRCMVGCSGASIAGSDALCLIVGRPGGELLSRVLGRSTIGAEGFHGRVRDGIGCIAPRNDHQVIERSAGRCSGLRPSCTMLASSRERCWIEIECLEIEMHE